MERKDWVQLDELEVGEHLLSDDGPVEVTSVRLLSSAESVYNLEVHGHHLYQVTELGVLVHNAGLGTYKKVTGPRGKKVRNVTQEHHGVPWDNKKFRHDLHDLVIAAKVSLKTYSKNLRDVTGHIGKHSDDYHKSIQRRMDRAIDGLKEVNEKTAKAALDKVLKGIWKDIGSGKLAPYKHKDVILS